MSTNMKILLAVAGVVALVGAGFYMFRSQQITAQYVEAAADCESGRGAGKLKALDRLYGQDARPKKLALALSTCALTDATERYRAVKGLLN